MIRKIALIFVTLSLVLAGCNLMQATDGKARAWIDAPLDGTKLPLAPYLIVFHASDPLGVTQMEVSINDQVLATIANPDKAQALVYLTQAWQPQQAGSYVIRVRAQNAAGNWSEPDSVTVVIEESTPTPTSTRTLTVTPSPTMTPTATMTATQTIGPVFSDLRLSGYVFYRRLINSSITFTLRVEDPAGIDDLRIYFCLRDPQTGEQTGWSNEAMSSLGNGLFTYTLSSQYPSFISSPLKDMTLVYQFIITHPDLSLVRSPTYSDVSLGLTP